MGGENTENNVEVRILPSQQNISLEKETDLDAVIKIVTKENQNKKRPPLNLALVLDRSGSMNSGKKLVNAKLAIQRVLRSLAVTDIIHFIVYGSSVSVIFEKGDLENVEELCRKVAAINTAGSTNLSGGLVAGIDCVTRHAQPNFQNRVFLFSDGLANEGIVKHDELFGLVTKKYDETSVKISAFGLGNDFDEELMKGIAECGAGTYFFIEGSEAIDKFVNIALGGVLTAVGSDAVLELACDNPTISSLSKIYAYELGPIKLGDLTDNNIRQIIARVGVKPQNQLGSCVVLRFTLSYAPSETPDQRVHTSGVLELNVVGESIEPKRDEEVEMAVAIARAGELDTEMIALLEKGENERAKACSEEQVRLLAPIAERTSAPVVLNLLNQVKRTQESLKREGYSASVKKQVHHQGYMKRRGSYGYIDSYE